MLAREIADVNFISDLKKKFDEGQPFKYVIIDNLLDEGFAKRLSMQFPSIDRMKTKYNGINERKAEHSGKEFLTPPFNKLKEILFSKEFLYFIEQVSTIKNLIVLDDRFGYGLHQGGNGSFLDIHIDYNLHPFKKKQRRLNLLIFLNEQWEENWGGMLQFWDSNVTKCITSIEPKFNRCIIFECNDISFHGYNKIHCQESITRKSFYTYFFSEPEESLKFHDTIFKTLPEDNKWKKIIVASKENLKNTIKRMLYKTGLIKLLE